MNDQTESTSEEQEQQLPSVEGAVEPAKGAEPAKVVEPKGRVYSEEEWNRRQSALDKQLEQVRREHGDATQRIQADYEALTKRLEEKEAEEWLAKVEEGGGDVDLARQVATAQRQVQEQQRAFQTEQRQLDEQRSVVNEALKNLKAHELVKQYALKDDTVAELLKATDPLEMENIALKNSLKVVLSKQVAPAKVDSGVGSSKGLDYDKMSPHEKAIWALEQLEEHRK